MEKFEVTTTAQVKRVYEVTASSIEQAHKRVRAHIADPEMLGEGIVTRKGESDSTPERIVGKGKNETPPEQSQLAT